MGQKIPIPDDKMQKQIDLLKMEKKDIAKLWKAFKSYDKDKSGAIDIDEFYKMLGEKRSLFGDTIFELIDIDNNAQLDFSEFMTVVSTYCMFGRVDIRKFCFYIFDKDKNGYIEADELAALIDLLHDNMLSGNAKSAMEKFDKNGDGKIDFGEFTTMDQEFPMLLFPAYRLQTKMMDATLSSKWWIGKQRDLDDERLGEIKKIEDAKQKETERKQKLRDKEVKRRMGALQYWICFWKRATFAARIAAKEAKRLAKLKEKEDEKNRRLASARKAREKEKAKKKKKKPKEEKKKRSTGDERKNRRESRRSHKGKSFR
jgi:Ca2+-binding EF-hand superfamily protein